MDILDRVQKSILQIFSTVKNQKKFYLTGGTALSVFYFKHRLSEDLDFMTSEENLLTFFVEDLVIALKNKNYNVDIRRKFDTFAELIVSEDKYSTKIHIAQDSPFRFESPRKVGHEIYIDSLINIITNKLLCIYGRYEIRDYIDIYFATEIGKMDLVKIIKKAKEKDPGLEEYYLALSFQKIEKFPDDINNIPVKMIIPINFKKVKKFFLENAVKLLDKRKLKC